MGLFQAFDICASGMTAQRFRTDIIAENVANVNTTRTEDGTPYRRKMVTFAERDKDTFYTLFTNKTRQYGGNGVKVAKILDDEETDYIMKYYPSHPDADENGYVSYPNVNIVQEMTDLIDASRGYEANVTAFNSVKSMAQSGLQVGKS